jgi:hypothetical protein
MPHKTMPNEEFRSFMQNSVWGSEFFHTPYQLACQLGLYCEAEDGLYYPRFDHDINEDEAKEYLEYWMPRYYVPNPYVGRNGFNDIDCPTYVLYELYKYTTHHANCTYKEAYKAIFHEEPTNNNDIVKNYINNYSRILRFEANGQLTITDINPNTIFDFMNRDDKKGFFDSFSQTNTITTKQVLITEHNKLTSFILSTIKHFDSLDRLDAIVPYANSSSPIKVSKEDLFSLTGMFLESTLEDVKVRNTNHTRWFEDQFRLGDRSVFLSTQWNANGDYQLTLDDFIKMIQCCYGPEYIYKTGPNGEHQLFLVSQQANNDLKGYPLQQIFYGAPGTGKSHRIKEIIQEHGIDEKKQVIRTTFHPDSDYSTFVGCYKPIMKSVPQTYVVEGKEKPVIDIATSQQSQKDEIVYDYTPQAFVQAYTKAWTNPNKPIILVIEEINRGNCAQIFGDIFQLLDRGDDGISEYEIKPDKALENYLKDYFAAVEDVEIPEQIKAGEIMKLPANLYIWATMNTSDQSLFPIDSAFKRRWEWKYIKIAWPYKKNEDGTFKMNENGEKIHFNYQIEGGRDWWDFLQRINAIIDKMTNSADKQLGYFFAKAKDDVISYDTFVSKVCFYLWNDIFKTYALDEQQGDLFRYTDNEGKTRQITFPAFYDGDGNVIKEVTEAFIDNVMRWNTDTKNDNI